MKQYPSFAIVISFFGLWLTSLFSSENQVFFGFIFILTFGILHGANDLVIIKKLPTGKIIVSDSKLLLYYILMVLVGGLMFYLVPLVVLLFFILISGYHFGEQQFQYLETNSNKIQIIYFQIIYGLLILFILFDTHSYEVISIIKEISNYTVDDSVIRNILKVIGVIFVFLYLKLFFRLTAYRDIFLKELFYLFVFTILFKVSSLIWGFAIYFIVWHSIPSLIDQIKFLYGDFNKVNCLRYLKSGLLYWIMSIIGLALFYFIFKEVKLFNSMFFSFLAAITFPHVLVILKMFGKNN